MVQPASYEPLWGDRWLISRACPNCGWEHEGVFPHAALRGYEDHLDEVDDKLWDDLARIQKRADRRRGRGLRRAPSQPTQSSPRTSSVPFRR